MCIISCICNLLSLLNIQHTKRISSSFIGYTSNPFHVLYNLCTYLVINIIIIVYFLFFFIPVKSNINERSNDIMAVAHKSAISVGLIYVPVSLYKTTRNTAISFNQLCKDENGKYQRIKYQKLCPSCNSEVKSSDIIKAYEYEKGKYVTISNDELERIKSIYNMFMYWLASIFMCFNISFNIMQNHRKKLILKSFYMNTCYIKILKFCKRLIICFKHLIFIAYEYHT